MIRGGSGGVCCWRLRQQASERRASRHASREGPRQRHRPPPRVVPCCVARLATRTAAAAGTLLALSLGAAVVIEFLAARRSRRAGSARGRAGVGHGGAGVRQQVGGAAVAAAAAIVFWAEADFRAATTWVVLRHGLPERMRATAPAMCGVAMPARTPKQPSGERSTRCQLSASCGATAEQRETAAPLPRCKMHPAAACNLADADTPICHFLPPGRNEETRGETNREERAEETNALVLPEMVL